MDMTILKVIIDQHLTFEAQARACSKACFAGFGIHYHMPELL